MKTVLEAQELAARLKKIKPRVLPWYILSYTEYTVAKAYREEWVKLVKTIGKLVAQQGGDRIAFLKDCGCGDYD